MQPQVEKQCARCGVKLVKWGNDYKLLTSQAERLWDQPIYEGKQGSLLQSESAFKSKVCNHLKDHQGCLFANS
jgi:hypothetical protein